MHSCVLLLLVVFLASGFVLSKMGTAQSAGRSTALGLVREIAARDIAAEKNACLDKLKELGIKTRSFSHEQLFTVSEQAHELNEMIPGA